VGGFPALGKVLFAGRVRGHTFAVVPPAPSEDQPTTKHSSENPKLAKDLTFTPLTRESPSKTLPDKEPLTTPPQLRSPSKSKPTKEV